MAHWRILEWCVVGVIILTMVASGGIGGDGGAAASDPIALGDGTATASIESLPTDQFRFDDGRFGTGVTYLRVPDVRVHVAEVRGAPRLVYRVRVPALGVDDSATKLLGHDGRRTVRIHGVDRGFDPESISQDRYTAIVSVRVQSFETDTTILSVNESVEVER